MGTERWRPTRRGAYGANRVQAPSGVTVSSDMFHADLHIHSRFSRACSKNCDAGTLAWWAARKGVAVVGTGDFTHPAWAAELAESLELPGADLSGEELTVRVVPRQADEFTCMSCFLVRHRSQLANEKKMICKECAQ